jgi:hypothetical protein
VVWEGWQAQSCHLDPILSGESGEMFDPKMFSEEWIENWKRFMTAMDEPATMDELERYWKAGLREKCVVCDNPTNWNNWCGKTVSYDWKSFRYPCSKECQDSINDFAPF